VGKAVPIDIAEVNGKTCFINMATGGFGTASPPKRRRN
jgi:diacylglycerol kinase family enzyme